MLVLVFSRKFYNWFLVLMYGLLISSCLSMFDAVLFVVEKKMAIQFSTKGRPIHLITG